MTKGPKFNITAKYILLLKLINLKWHTKVINLPPNDSSVLMLIMRLIICMGFAVSTIFVFLFMHFTRVWLKTFKTRNVLLNSISELNSCEGLFIIS